MAVKYIESNKSVRVESPEFFFGDLKGNKFQSSRIVEVVRKKMDCMNDSSLSVAVGKKGNFA